MNNKHQEKGKLGHVVGFTFAVYNKVNVTDDKQQDNWTMTSFYYNYQNP